MLLNWLINLYTIHEAKMKKKIINSQRFIIIFFLLFFQFTSFIVVNEVASANVIYTYDNNGRLISAEYSDGTAIFYSYDAAGNRITKEVISGNHCNNADRNADGDVDGSDLFIYMSDMNIDLADFSANFGKNDCTF